MPSSDDDEDLLPSFKPAWAREGGIPKPAPAAAPPTDALPMQTAGEINGLIMGMTLAGTLRTPPFKDFPHAMFFPQSDAEYRAKQDIRWAFKRLDISQKPRFMRGPETRDEPGSCSPPPTLVFVEHIAPSARCSLPGMLLTTC